MHGNIVKYAGEFVCGEGDGGGRGWRGNRTDSHWMVGWLTGWLVSFSPCERHNFNLFNDFPTDEFALMTNWLTK